MLIFQYDLLVSNATTYREPDLLMPVTVRMKSTDNKANVNIIEFDTNALFKYTFNNDGVSEGFTFEIFPKNVNRIIKGKDILGLFTYKLTFDENQISQTDMWREQNWKQVQYMLVQILKT